MLNPSDYPNRTLGKRRLLPSDVVDEAVVVVNMQESPLGWLARRGLLTERQVWAGEKLREDHARSGLSSRVTMRWEEGPRGGNSLGGGADYQTLGAIDAKRRFDAALEMVGPGLSDILWRVVCEGEGLTEAEKGLGWPMRAAKLVLGMALDRLCCAAVPLMACHSVIR